MSSSAAAPTPATATPTERQRERKRCLVSVHWFTTQYCRIYDATERKWLPFTLWREQGQVLETLLNNRQVIVLKARQLGMTWLMLAYALWLMLFRPAATILLFSKRDDEARHLLERLKGMYDRLPEWMRDLARKDRDGPRLLTDNEHVLEFGNGSVARAFPSTAGDSYTATFVLIDEADLVPNLGKLLASTKPTIDGGGQMALISRVDKTKPQSEFKAIYRAARQKVNDWTAVFLPWCVRPGRDRAWYETQRDESLSRTGGLDYLWEQYPEKDEQALAPNQKDKRLPAAWLMRCYEPEQPIPLDDLAFRWLQHCQGAEESIPPTDLLSKCPLIPGLEIYRLPVVGREYVIGSDTAEGNPTSDDSTVTVLDADTGEEVAALAGKFEPATLAAHIDAIGLFYNNAPALVERNNHGHTVIQELRNSSKTRLLRGFDKKPGWLTTERGKALLYDTFARVLRDDGTLMHSAGTYTQLAGIEGTSLSAPEGEMDDRAMGYVIANKARDISGRSKIDFV